MSSTSTSPSPRCFAVTPSDSVNFSKPVRQIYVGGAGNVVVVQPDGTSLTFSSVPAGSILGPFYISRINATNTTATNIVGFE